MWSLFVVTPCDDAVGWKTHLVRKRVEADQYGNWPFFMATKAEFRQMGIIVSLANRKGVTSFVCGIEMTPAAIGKAVSLGTPPIELPCGDIAFYRNMLAEDGVELTAPQLLMLLAVLHEHEVSKGGGPKKRRAVPG